MSSKACEHYTGHCHWHKLYRRIFAAFLALLILTILIVWLVLRPTRPKFYLRDLTISQLSLPDTFTNLLTSNLQVTLSGFYYDRLDVYAEYKNQRVTIPTSMPTGYQGHDDFAVWPPYLHGTAVPVSPDLTASLSQDENARLLLMDVKVEGRLRWKVGTWVSGHYHLYVSCPAFLTVNSTSGNGGNGGGFKFQQMSTCSVDV